MAIGALLISEEGIGSQVQDGTNTLRCTERLRIGNGNFLARIYELAMCSIF